MTPQNQLLENIASIYCDGGVLKKNPSPFGGTYAYFFLNEAGEEVAAGSGFVWPNSPDSRQDQITHDVWACDLPTVTNNVTELCAIVFALQQVVDGFDGTLYSDSYVTLCRMRNAKKWEGVPEALKKAALIERERHPNITYILLDGHPTKAQLEAKVGKRGHPCSPWNVKCDKQCGVLSDHFFGLGATS